MFLKLFFYSSTENNFYLETFKYRKENINIWKLIKCVIKQLNKSFAKIISNKSIVLGYTINTSIHMIGLLRCSEELLHHMTLWTWVTGAWWTFRAIGTILWATWQKFYYSQKSVWMKSSITRLLEVIWTYPMARNKNINYTEKLK